MPVHEFIDFGEFNLDQTSPAGAASAFTRLGPVNSTVGGTHQPISGAVKKTVGLVIHLHRYVGTSIQVGMHLPPIANRKGTAIFAQVDDIERDCVSAIDQIL